MNIFAIGKHDNNLEARVVSVQNWAKRINLKALISCHQRDTDNFLFWNEHKDYFHCGKFFFEHFKKSNFHSSTVVIRYFRVIDSILNVVSSAYPAYISKFNYVVEYAVFGTDPFYFQLIDNETMYVE